MARCEVADRPEDRRERPVGQNPVEPHARRGGRVDVLEAGAEKRSGQLADLDQDRQAIRQGGQALFSAAGFGHDQKPDRSTVVSDRNVRGRGDSVGGDSGSVRAILGTRGPASQPRTVGRLPPEELIARLGQDLADRQPVRRHPIESRDHDRLIEARETQDHHGLELDPGTQELHDFRRGRLG